MVSVIERYRTVKEGHNQLLNSETEAKVHYYSPALIMSLQHSASDTTEKETNTTHAPTVLNIQTSTE